MRLARIHTRALVGKLCAIEGVEPVFDRPGFHECVLRLPQPAGQVLAVLNERDILGGFDLAAAYPELGNAILVCATETKTEADLKQYATALQEVLA